MYNWDLNNPAVYDSLINTDVVIPKENSQLHSQIKNSETFQKWVAENYDTIKNQTNTNSFIEFPKSLSDENAQKSLFATIHNADLNNFKINEDGSLSGELLDGYDFDEMKDETDNLKEYALKRLNNNAYVQQEKGKLQRYLISNQIHLTKEELDEILRKYGYIK